MGVWHLGDSHTLLAPKYVNEMADEMAVLTEMPTVMLITCVVIFPPFPQALSMFSLLPSKIDRVIKVAGEEDLKAFQHLFTKTSRKNFADGHLWFSIFAKPANSVGRYACPF